MSLAFQAMDLQECNSTESGHSAGDADAGLELDLPEMEPVGQECSLAAASGPCRVFPDIPAIVHSAVTEPQLADLPWSEVETDLNIDGQTVQLEIRRKNASDEAVKGAFCDGAPDAERYNVRGERTGYRLNEIAARIKSRIGDAFREETGSIKHDYRVQVDFERFHKQERYYFLWDVAFEAVEYVGAARRATRFFVFSRPEMGIVRAFLRALQEESKECVPENMRERPRALFRFEFVDEGARGDYPKKVVIRPMGPGFVLPAGAEVCKLKSGPDGNMPVEMENAVHRAPRRNGRRGGAGAEEFREAVTEPESNSADSFFVDGGSAVDMYEVFSEASLTKACKAIDKFISYCTYAAGHLGTEAERLQAGLSSLLERELKPCVEKLGEVELADLARSVRDRFDTLTASFRAEDYRSSEAFLQALQDRC